MPEFLDTFINVLLKIMVRMSNNKLYINYPKISKAESPGRKKFYLSHDFMDFLAEKDKIITVIKPSIQSCEVYAFSDIYIKGFV